MPVIFALTAPFAPFVALAQNPAPPANFGVIGNTTGFVISFLNGYIIPLLIAVAFLAFIWGMFTYFIRGGASEEGRQQGKQLAVYAVAGFVLIVSLWGIVNVIAGGMGFRAPELRTMPPVPIPGSPNCTGGGAC